MPASLKLTLKKIVSPAIYRPFLTRWRKLRAKPVALESLPRLNPISRIHGLERGTPIDRYYIEQFLAAHAQDIKGRTLEMADPRYTRQFGGAKVSQADVLHLVAGNPEATLVGDLATGEGIPTAVFDCLIVINTLFLIYEVRAAIAHCYQALKSGGVLLAHFPGICQRIPEDEAWAGDYWRFTSQSVRRLCEEFFPRDNVTVEVYGNVLVATAFLHGLAAEELNQEQLDYRDRDYEMLITVRAVKP